MAKNYTQELNKIARDIEELYRQEITRQKLIDSGNLLKSFKVHVIKGKNNGLSFQLEAKEYFSHLDKKYSITSNILKSKGWERVKERLTSLYNLIITEEIKDGL